MELRQVLQALKNADAAGDVEGARRLAEIANRLAAQQQAAPEAATPKPEGGFIPAAKAGFESLKGDVALLGGKLGLMSEQEAEAYQKAREAEAARIFKPTEEGWLESPWQKLKETAGGSAAYMAAPLAAGAAAALAPVTAPTAALLGTGAAGLTSLAQFTGSNLARQMGTGKTLEEADLGTAALAAVPQAALDTLSMRMIPGIGKLLGSVGKEVTEEGAKALAQQTLKQAAIDYAKATGKAMPIEGFTETAQQILERAQAGLSITDPQARAEYVDSFIGGAALAGALGGPGRFVERRSEIAQGQRLEQDRLAREGAAAEQARQEEEQRRAAAQEQFKQSDDYALDVEQRFNAFNAQVKALREKAKARVEPGDLAGKAEQKEAGQQLSELVKENRDLITEYNAIKNKLPEIREKQRVAGMAPMDYMLEQTGEVPVAARTKGPATLPSDEELGFVPPELPTDAASRFVNERISLAKAQVVEPQISDYQSYLLTDRGMAERAVAERPAINGLSAKEQRQLYDSVESLIKLQKQAEAKAAEEKRLAQRKEEERQLAEELKTRQELLQAQKPAKAVDTRMRTFLEQTDELAALYPESERREDAIFGRFFDPTQSDLVASDSPAPSAALGQMQQRLTGQDVTYTGEDTGRTKGRVIPAADVGLSLFPTPSGGEAVTKESLSARIERLLNRDDISDEARALLERAAPAVQRGDTTLEQARRGAGEYGTASSNFYGLLDEQLSAIESGREGIVRAGAPRSFPERLQAFPTGTADSSVDVDPTGFAGPRQPGVGGLRDRVTQDGIPKELKKTADALGPETIRGKSAGVNAPLSRARELSEVLAVGEQAAAGGSRVNELRQLLSAQEQALAGETDPGIRTAYERAIARTQQQLADAQKKPQAREEVQRELSPEMASGKGTVATTRAAFMAVQRAQLGKAEKEAKAAAAEIAKLEAKIAPAKAALQKVYGQLHTVTESLSKFDEIKASTLSKLDLANRGISAFEARVQEARVAARKAAALEANAAPAFAKIDVAVAEAAQQVADLEAQLNTLVEQTGVTRTSNGDLQAMRMQNNGLVLPIDPATAAAEERVLVYNVQSINKTRSRLRVAQQRLQRLSAQREAISSVMNWYMDRAESMSSAPKLQAILDDIKQQATALEADLAKPKTELQTLLEARRVELENARATIERDLLYFEQQTSLKEVEEKTVEKTKPTAGRVTADASMESLGKKMANLRLKMWDAFYDGVLSKAGVRIRALTEAERIERGLEARKTLEETGVALAKIRKVRANTEAKALASKGGYNKYDAMLKWIDMELGRANKALFDATQKAGAARNKSLSYLSVDDGALAPITRFEGPASIRYTYKAPVSPTRNVVAFKGMGEALREHSKHSMYIEALESEREAVLRDMLADKPRALAEAAAAASPRAGTAAELEAIDRAFENQQLLASMPPRIKSAQLELEEALVGTDKKKQDSARKALVDLLAEQQALLKTADRGRTGPAVRSTSSAPAKMRTGLLEFAEERRTSTKKPVSDAAMAVPNRAMSAKEQREANRIAEEIRTKLPQQEANRIAEELRKKTSAQKAKEAREAAAVAKELAKLRQEWAADDDLASAVRDSGMYDGRPTTELNAATKEAVNDGRVLDVVDRLAADGSTPFVREVAQRLRPLLMRVKLRVQENLTDSKGVPVEGLYNPATATVTMDKQAMTEEALMHELVHPATLAALDADPATLTPAQQQARADLEALVERIKGQPAFAKEYGATNTKEFVSELLSNQQLRDKLDQRNFLQRIYDALLRMLGMTPKSVSAKAVEDAFTLFAPARPSQGAVVASVMRGAFPGNKPVVAPDVPVRVAELMNNTVGKQPTLVDKIMANLTGLGFRTQFVDRLAPAEKLLQQGVEKGMLSDVQLFQTSYFLRFGEQRNQFVAQAAGDGVPQLRKTADGDYVIETPEGDHPNIAKIAALLRDANAGNEQAAERMFTLYLAAKRGEQVGFDKLNFDTPMTPADAKQINDYVAADPKRQAAFEKARKMYREYNNQLLKLAEQMDALSAEDVKRLSQGDYVPYYRERGGVVELIVAGEKPMRIGNLTEQPYLKELVGGNDRILPFFTGAMQNTSMLMDLALRNKQTREMAQVLSNLGLLETRGKVNFFDGDGPTDVRRKIQFKIDGQLKYAMVTDATENFGVPADLLVQGMQGIKTTMPAALKLMAIPSDWLRKFVTRSPVYALRQIVRDSINGWLVTGGNFKPIVSSVKELAGMTAGRSPNELLLQRAGAISSNVFTGDQQDNERILRDIAAGKTGWQRVMAKADAFALQGDAATRAVLYHSYRKQGMTHMQALLGSLESMNFSRRGLSPSMQAMSMLVPFFNAQVQGLDVVYRSARGKSTFEKRLGVQRKMMARGLMITAATLAYAAMMQDDEAYKNATPEQRALNWFMYVPGIDEPVRIPIPFELGYIFKALPELFFNTAFGDTKSSEAMKAIGGMAYQTVPMGLPQAIKPALEVLTNYSLFTGAPIEYAREKGLEKAERFRENTTELSKLLGQAGILSPIQLDYLIRGYTGGLGLALLSIADAPLSALSPADVPESATKKLSQYPIIGTLFQPTDGRGIIDSAYKEIERWQQASATFEKMVAEGRRSEAMKYAQEYSRQIALNSFGGSYRQQMGDLAKIKRQIAASQLSPAEKRERIDAIRQIEIALAARVRQAAQATEGE